MKKEKLAIIGGKPVRKVSLSKRVEQYKKTRFGQKEIKLLKEVIKSGNLSRYYGGTKVNEFEKEFSKLLGVKYATTSTSGTAAIHLALGAININPGEKVITSPFSDMGTIIPILFQNAIPIFADINPET